MSIYIFNCVKKIGVNAFVNCSTLSTIELPAELEQLSAGAFNNCSSLNKITINSKLKNIGDYAFAGTKITELYIPETVERIGYGILQASFNLKKITVPYVGGERGSNAVFGYFFAFDNSNISNLYGCHNS